MSGNLLALFSLLIVALGVVFMFATSPIPMIALLIYLLLNELYIWCVIPVVFLLLSIFRR